MDNISNFESIKKLLFEHNYAFDVINKSLDLGYFSINVEDQMIWLDDKASTYFKFAKARNFPLKKWFDLLSNDVSKSIKNLLEKICKNQQETSYQINQDSMDYQLFFKPLIHEQKTCEIIGYIYQVGALEKQIHPTEDKLSILSNMTHEIRTPVNAIKGYSELLEETDLNDTQKEYLDHLQDTSKHLLKIVNDILDYSKLEAGKMQIENKPFKIKKLLDEVHSMLIEQTK
ncbi:MAG: hypothetical protein CVV61_08990, partial [Tenericutes bacterium HGW-Tenericutes-6]